MVEEKLSATLDGVTKARTCHTFTFDASQAAYAVGYQSPQQFNRDYKHLFGISPGKSIREQRQSLYEALTEKPTAP